MRHLVGSPRNFAARDLPLICFKVVPFLYYSRETTFPREYRGFAPLLGEKKGNRPRWEENGDREAGWRAREVGNIAVENGNMRREKSFESRHSLKQAVSRELTRKKGKKCDERVGQKRANRKLYPGQCGPFPCAILLFSLARWGCQAWSLLVATGDPRLAATRQTLLISLFPRRGLRLFVGGRNLFVLRLDAGCSDTSRRQSRSTNQFNRFDKLRAAFLVYASRPGWNLLPCKRFLCRWNWESVIF